MEKHRRRAMPALVLGSVVALVLSGCGGGGAGQTDAGTGEYSGPKVEVAFWNGFTGGNALTLTPELLKQFNAEHENIVVKSSPLQWDDLDAKMPLALRAGKGPDVAVAHGEDIATYAAQGLVIPADKITKRLGYTEDDFPTGVFAAAEYEGHQYGVPYSVTPLGLYVNTAVMEDAGIDPDAPLGTAEEIDAVLDDLKAAGVAGEWVSGFRYNEGLEFESLLWQYGGDLFNEDLSEPTFNSEAGVKALTYMVDKIDSGYSPKNVAEGGPLQAFITGKTALSWQGSWSTSDPALESVEWKALPAPTIGSTPAFRTGSTQFMFMRNRNQDANKTAAAVVFVKWMEEHSLDWASTGELPAFNEVREDPELLETYPVLEPFVGELDAARYYPTKPGIGAVIKLISPAINEAVLGKKTPKQALDDAAVTAKQLLDRNASQYGG